MVYVAQTSGSLDPIVSCSNSRLLNSKKQEGHRRLWVHRALEGIMPVANKTEESMIGVLDRSRSLHSHRLQL